MALKGLVRAAVKQGMKSASPQGAGAVDENAGRLRELAYQYIDGGATRADYLGENSGVYNNEALVDAWVNAEKEKKMYNQAAKMFLTGQRDMAAFHAADTIKMLKSVREGGIPSPSIGIARDPAIMDDYGDWKIVMNPSAFNPELAKNIVTVEDMWSPVADIGGDLRQNTLEMTLGDPIGHKTRMTFQIPAFRSMVEGPAKSLEDIRGRREQMISEDSHIFDFDEIHERSFQYNEDLHQVYESEDPVIGEFANDIYSALKFDDVMFWMGDTKRGAGKHTFTTSDAQDAIKMALYYNGIPGEVIKNLPPELAESMVYAANKAMNMPIRYQEAKPQKALRFGPGQDIDFVIAPSGDLEPKHAQARAMVIEALEKNGVTVVEADGTGMAQVPDLYKFAAPPIVTYMGLKAALEAEEEEKL